MRSKMRSKAASLIYREATLPAHPLQNYVEINEGKNMARKIHPNSLTLKPPLPPNLTGKKASWYTKPLTQYLESIHPLNQLASPSIKCTFKKNFL